MKEFLLKTLDQSHGFVGGAPGQAEEIAAMFGVKGVFYSPPYRSFSSENAVDDWNRFLDLCPNRVPPSCVWVGLGAPKQEFWMQTISPLAPATLFFGVGAAFDFLSGSIKRAPKWMRDSGFEWLYRASQEPKRLFIRYLITNTKFLYLATAELLKRDFYR
jgi:N-acetylglucosaminyldiphosphoundecaprenol N-acetyl-beta-D-mannosaminyltransferase